MWRVTAPGFTSTFTQHKHLKLSIFEAHPDNRKNKEENRKESKNKKKN